MPGKAEASRRLRLAGVTATALVLGACARVATQSSSMTAVQITASTNQLQLQTFELGRQLATLIEVAADSIRAASADSAVRRHALLWKISAIPLAQEAALRTDPQVAAVDLLMFTIQQRDYVTTGAGRNSFGPQQPIAIAAALDAEQAVLGLATRILHGGQLQASAEARMRDWAARHPMRGPALRRVSVIDSDWEALGLSNPTLVATVGNIDRTLVNITFRLGYLNETLAAQARWNAELAAEQALDATRVDSLIRAGTATLNSVGTLADDAPALIDRQREAMMRDIDRQRVAMMLDIDRQRVAVMRDIDRQRVLTFQDLATQRVALEAALTAERTAVLLSADSLVHRSIDRSGAMLRRLAWELTVAALIVVAAVLGSGLVLINRWRAAP